MANQQQKPAESAPPPVAAYQPNWDYKSTASGQKLDVTLGIIAPQFSTGSQLYQQAYRDDDVVKGMLSAMRATFNVVLTAKGFSTTGPFDSLEEMTFPDKQGTDLVLYPEFDVQVEVKVDNVRNKAADKPAEPSGGGLFGNLVKLNNDAPQQQAPVAPAQICDVELSARGVVVFVAEEPLSKQKMWSKKVDVPNASQSFTGQEGPACDGKPAHWNQDIKNAWAKAHEAIFQETMKKFDAYVDGNEFKVLKQTGIEARKKTNFGG
jgi:hypothetical protein